MGFCAQKEINSYSTLIGLSGDLIQTLLIQVQKTKVDVDLAMAALDKLLKSNELNFAFLGKCGKKRKKKEGGFNNGFLSERTSIEKKMNIAIDIIFITTVISCRTFYVINLCFILMAQKYLFKTYRTSSWKDCSTYTRSNEVKQKQAQKQDRNK